MCATGSREASGRGFGHPVYRTKDPRSEMLKGIARGYDDPLVGFAVAVEDAFERSSPSSSPVASCTRTSSSSPGS